MGRLLGFILCLIASSTNAETFLLTSQFGGQKGLSWGSGDVQCSNPSAKKYVQCVHPEKPYAAVGHVTVKANATEVFLMLQCGTGGGSTVWATERLFGTTEFTTPQFPDDVDGPCWVYYELLNNVGLNYPDGPTDGALMEYQITIYSK